MLKSRQIKHHNKEYRPRSDQCNRNSMNMSINMNTQQQQLLPVRRHGQIVMSLYFRVWAWWRHEDYAIASNDSRSSAIEKFTATRSFWLENQTAWMHIFLLLILISEKKFLQLRLQGTCIFTWPDVPLIQKLYQWEIDRCRCTTNRSLILIWGITVFVYRSELARECIDLNRTLLMLMSTPGRQ